MNTAALPTRTHSVPLVALVPFLIIVFGVTWGLLGLYALAPETMNATFGEIGGDHPLFILCVYSPAIAAFSLVLYWGGLAGLKAFLSRLLLWRCPLPWALFLVVGIPLVFAAGSLVKGNLFTSPFPFESVGAMLGAMLFMVFLGPIEEFGWRGVALPLLQRHMAPIWAALLIGAVWGIWHLPAFYLSGTVQSAWNFTPFFVGTICLSVIVTPLFNAGRGSLLLAAIFHFQVINPLWPDAQPYDTWFFLVVAALIVWLNRDTMFTSTGAVTEVIPDEGMYRA